MWDVTEAKKLIERARKTDSVLAHTLVDYLGYAIGTIECYIGTIECYKSLLDETEKK